MIASPDPRPRAESPHVPESPLVPDGSTPGTQVHSRPARPLTRRELRDRSTLPAEPVGPRVGTDSAFGVSGARSFESLLPSPGAGSDSTRSGAHSLPAPSPTVTGRADATGPLRPRDRREPVESASAGRPAASASGHAPVPSERPAAAERPAPATTTGDFVPRRLRRDPATTSGELAFASGSPSGQPAHGSSSSASPRQAPTTSQGAAPAGAPRAHEAEQAPVRSGRRAAPTPAPAPAPSQGAQHHPFVPSARTPEGRVVAEPNRSTPVQADRDARSASPAAPQVDRARAEQPVRPRGRAAAAQAAPEQGRAGAERQAPYRKHPGAERQAPYGERPVAERPVPQTERPESRSEPPQREYSAAELPPERRPIAERPASMRPLQPQAPRLIPADAPRPADRPTARRDAPRDLRADSTDDLSAVLSAAANTGRAPDGLEFREFDVEPPRDLRHPSSERASAARGGAPAGARSAARPDRTPPVPPAARADDPALARRAAPAFAPATAPAVASRPVSRRSLRNALTSRAASTVAMGFVALLAVATSVPSLSLLSPADVQAMAYSETQVLEIDGQHVEITGGATAAMVGSEAYQAQSIEEYARAAGIRPKATFTNNPLGTIQWPFAVGVHIGDRFGYRNCAGCSTNHRGQDFNPGDGAQIQSIADGVVSVSTESGGSLGAVTMIDHVIDGQTVTSVYAHMQYGTRRFEVGDRVEVGDVIGNTGSTGMSTGPHLHFEIRIGGVGGTHVDPLEWLWANTN